MKTKLHYLFILLAGAHQATAAVLLSDDFNSNVLDTSKWSINTSAVVGSMVVVTNQRCEITARGYLNTLADYDPSAPGGLLITGTWTFVNASGNGADLPWIVTRSSGVPTPYYIANGEVSDGVNFRISVTPTPSPSQFYIAGSGGATVTGLNVISNTLNLAQGDSVNFTITDDGTNLSFSMAKIGDPTQAATATAICTSHLAANKISFYNRENTSDIAAVDTIVVQTIPPSGPQVSIKMFAGIILNNGNIGSNYLIQATANLASSNWTTLTNVTLPSQPYIYIDYSSYTNSQQFYRVQPQ
jgi:hypothetical protein